MKLLQLIFMNIIFICSFSYAQMIPEVNVLKSCNKMNELVFYGKINEALEYFYPSLFKVVPKKEVYSHLFNMRNFFDEKKFHILSMVCENPIQKDKVGNKFIVLLPVVTTANTPNGIFKNTNYTLGVSEDLEKTWKFININNEKDNYFIKSFFPDGLGNIRIPKIINGGMQ